MRLVLISDTHGLHNGLGSLPEGDILVHAGDFMNAGHDFGEIISFNRWLGQQPFRYRIVCAGNHDRLFENQPDLARTHLSNALYLEESGIKIEGLSFWGSPYTPEFFYWAFMYSRGERALDHWDRIPDKLDVLITHGPPHGILDQSTPGGSHLGCEELAKAVSLKKPKVHVFGHIHGGAGIYGDGVTTFVNAAYLNESYKPLEPAGKVRVVDL
jgi:Icc-related predicted phosphoesterase